MTIWQSEAAGFTTFSTYFHASSHVAIARVRTLGVEGGSITKLKSPEFTSLTRAMAAQSGLPVSWTQINLKPPTRQPRETRRVDRRLASSLRLCTQLNFRPWRACSNSIRPGNRRRYLLKSPTSGLCDLTRADAIQGFWRGDRSGWRHVGSVSVDRDSHRENDHARRQPDRPPTPTVGIAEFLEGLLPIQATVRDVIGPSAKPGRWQTGPVRTSSSTAIRIHVAANASLKPWAAPAILQTLPIGNAFSWCTMQELPTAQKTFALLVKTGR